LILDKEYISILNIYIPVLKMFSMQHKHINARLLQVYLNLSGTIYGLNIKWIFSGSFAFSSSFVFWTKNFSCF